MPASIATTAAVAICGQVEDGNGVAPLNAISHIIWGESAARKDEVSIDHTLAGVRLNSVVITSLVIDCWARAVHSESC